MKNARSVDLAAGWQISATACSDHARWAADGGRLFASPAWAGVLAMLPAEPLFAWHAGRGLGVVVPVFRRLGLRIGFLGLPAAGGEFDVMDGRDLAASMAGIASAARLNFVRTTQYMQTHFDRAASGARPEVWIDDLPNWQVMQRKRLRKDLSFARRTATAIEIVDADIDAYACHRLYAATVARHHGSERYRPAYFAALNSLARNSTRIGFFAAREGAVVRGFAVVALHGDLASYLHGAVDDDGRRQGISDLLLEKLIAYGRAGGARRFTFLSSPWTQAGLLHFKQKWGDTVGLSTTFDRGYGAFGYCAMLVSRWQSRHDRRMAERQDGQRPINGGRQAN